MDNEHRNSIVEGAVKSASEDNWDFLTARGIPKVAKIEMFQQSLELRKIAIDKIKRDMSFLGKLPREVVVLLLQPEAEYDNNPRTASEESKNDSRAAEADEEDSSSEDEAWIPDEISDSDSIEGGDDYNDDEYDDSDDYDDDDDTDDDITDSSNDDSILKKVVLMAQKLHPKQVASVIGLIVTLILLPNYPFGVLNLLVGIVPLIAGIVGNEMWRNSFRPMKLFWFVCSLVLSFCTSPFLFFVTLVVGLIILIGEKLKSTLAIPESKDDAVIAKYFTLSKLGIPVIWRRFTIERSGGTLRFTNVEKLYGGNNSQAFLYCKDPELVSSFAGVFFGGYQYLTLKDTKTGNLVLNVRLPRSIVQNLVSTGFLAKLCETAKESSETAVRSVIHS